MGGIRAYIMMRKNYAVKEKTVQSSSGTHRGCNRTAGATGRCHEEPRKNREDLILLPKGVAGLRKTGQTHEQKPHQTP